MVSYRISTVYNGECYCTFSGSRDRRETFRRSDLLYGSTPEPIYWFNYGNHSYCIFNAEILKKTRLYTGEFFWDDRTILSIVGIIYYNLTYFSIGLFFTGIAIGTAQQFRFAALEEAPKALHAKAVGLVMSGGIAAALIGPTLAVMTQRFFTEYPFAGPFSALTLIYVIAFILLLRVPLKKSNNKGKTIAKRNVVINNCIHNRY